MTYAFRPGPYSSHGVLLAWAGEGHGRTLLDVGAGDNVLALRLRHQGWKVTALDWLAYPSVDVVADLDRELPDLGRFDCIVAGDVLEHLCEPQTVLAWLRESLVPDGRLLVSAPNAGHLAARALVALVGRPQHTRGIFDRTHRHFWSAGALRGLVRAAGFRITWETATPVPLGPFRGVQSRLASRWPHALGYQTVLEARP